MDNVIKAGTGEPVLFIQGVGARGEAWRPQLDGLADRYRVLAFDNRGMDGARVEPGTLSIEGMANDALDVLDREGIARAHLVGHSMGGLIAQQVALVAPSRVRSLAFLNTFCRGSEATRMTPDIIWRGLRTRVGTRAMRRQAFLDLILPAARLRHVDRHALAESLGRLFGRDLADQPAIVGQQLKAMSRFDASARLGELASIPTLVVSGAEDHIALPAFGRALATAIADADYVELAGVGHAAPISNAEMINELLHEHFGRVDGRPGAAPRTVRLRADHGGEPLPRKGGVRQRSEATRS